MSDKELNDEITRIHQRDGGVKASALLDASRPEEAPLHRRFEWNDHKAAEQHRLAQARRLVQQAHVVLGDESRQRLVNVPAEKPGTEGIYRVISAVANDIDEFRRTFSASAMRVEAAKRNVEALERFASDVDGVEMAELVQIRTALSALHAAEDALKAH